jgi:uncharacterized protein
MEKEVEFKVGEEILRGTIFTPEGEGPFPGVVFFHGRGSSRGRYLEISRRLSAKGIMALAFDFRGCGESDGNFEEQKQRMGIDDGRAAIEFLLSQKVDPKRIGVIGTSFGGFVASILMKDYDVKSLVLRAPAVYPNELLDINVKTIADYYHLEKDKWLSSVAYEGISHFKGNLLVIESEKDEVVRDWVVRNYYDRAENAAKKELFVQKGAGHDLRNNPESLEEFYKLTFDWFIKTL